MIGSDGDQTLAEIPGDDLMFNPETRLPAIIQERRDLPTRPVMWSILGILLWTCIPGQASLIARPGPSSGILVQEAPGFILTDKRIITQKVCISVDPRTSTERRFLPQNIQSPEIKEWYSQHLKAAQTRAEEILIQARKPFVPIATAQEKRPKRFIGALIAGLIFTVLGTIVSTTISAANSVSVKTLANEIENLQMSIRAIHHELETQKSGLMDLITVVNNTVVTVNLHSELLARSIDLHQTHELFKRELLFIQEPIFFHTLAFLSEIQNGMNDLSHGHIPLYFVSTEMVKNLLNQVSGGEVEDFQINLAFETGSAMPLYINPEDLEVCFLLALPYVSSKNVFQMKTIHNVGTWKGDIHVQIKTPDLIAYQPWVPDLYAIPLLKECTRFKDINFQCHGNPFVYDTTHALCGLEYDKHGSEQCEVQMRKTADPSEVQAILVKDEWLVSSALKNMSIFYEKQIMSRTIALPATVSIIKVPTNARITIGKTTLYPVGTEVWEGVVESVDAFQHQDIPINPDLKFLLEHKPNHTIQMSIRKDNLSIEDFDYTEKDHMLLESRSYFPPTDIIILLLIGLLILWLVILTIHMVKVARKVHRELPTVLRLVSGEYQP